MANFKNNPSKPVIVKVPNSIRKHLTMHERNKADHFIPSPQVARIINEQKKTTIKSFFKSVWSKIMGKK